MFDFARELVTLEAAAATATTRTHAVKARKVLDEIAEDLDELEIDQPSSEIRGEDLWPAIRSLGKETLGEWSLGRWHRPPRKSETGRSTIRRIP